MSLCEDCSSCDHDYCDNCMKCRLCGVFANSPASPPVYPGRTWPYRNPEWIPKSIIAPSAFNENDYTRYLNNQRGSGSVSFQVH